MPFSVSDHYHRNVNAKMRTVHTIPQKWWMSPLTENHICQTITIPWNWTLLPFGLKLKITMSSWSILSLFRQLYCTFTSKYWFELHNWPFSCLVQLILIKWQLYVTSKKFPDKGVFPFENGVKNGFFPYYLSFRAQKRTATRIAI